MRLKLASLASRYYVRIGKSAGGSHATREEGGKRKLQFMNVSGSWQSREAAFCGSTASACFFSFHFSFLERAERNAEDVEFPAIVAGHGCNCNYESAPAGAIRAEQRDRTGARNDYVYFRVTRARTEFPTRSRKILRRMHACAGQR